MSITFQRWQKNGLDRFYVDGLGGGGRAWLEAGRGGEITVQFDAVMRRGHRSTLPVYTSMVLEAIEARGIDPVTAKFTDLVAAYEAATTQEVAV